jgi:hypothetical protein
LGHHRSLAETAAIVEVDHAEVADRDPARWYSRQGYTVKRMQPLKGLRGSAARRAAADFPAPTLRTTTTPR